MTRHSLDMQIEMLSWHAAQEFLTRDFLRMSAEAWGTLEDKQREDFLSKKLWVKDNQRVCHP